MRSETARLLMPSNHSGKFWLFRTITVMLDSLNIVLFARERWTDVQNCLIRRVNKQNKRAMVSVNAR